MVVSFLRNRNVTIEGRRTSMKLEPAMWDALDEISRRENTSVHDVCSQIARQHDGRNLTAATRAFVLAYFRAAATEEGHLRAGHGRLHSPSAAPEMPRMAVRSLESIES